ncbi:unnamed protein product, partial [Polarella glacialis]
GRRLKPSTPFSLLGGGLVSGLQGRMMRSMAVPQAPLPRRRSLAAPLLAAAAAVTALLAAAPRFLLPTDGGAAFVAGPSGALGLAPSRAASTAEGRVARFAE